MFPTRSFFVCRRCAQLREKEASEGYPTPQRCGCDRGRAGDPRWDRYDFNEHLDLCRCCRMVALDSGSRWAVWFCGDCKDLARTFNGEVGRAVVPIGEGPLTTETWLQAAPALEDVVHAGLGGFPFGHRLRVTITGSTSRSTLERAYVRPDVRRQWASVRSPAADAFSSLLTERQGGSTVPERSRRSTDIPSCLRGDMRKLARAMR